jgi:hypothetical protein
MAATPSNNNVLAFVQRHHSEDEQWSPYSPADWRTYDTGRDGNSDSDTVMEDDDSPSTSESDSVAESAFSHNSAPHSIVTVPPQAASWTNLGFVPNDNSTTDFTLWCEFSSLLGCDVTFRGDDEARWIRHHLQHLGEEVPRRMVCWFCDDHPPFKWSANTKHGDPFSESKAVFEERMQHIRQHIFDDWQTIEAQRPDFHMVQHLYKHGRLDRNVYDAAMSYSELPAAYRLPEDMEDYRSGAIIENMENERRRYRKKHRMHGWDFEVRDPRARRAGRNPRIAIIQEHDDAGVEVLLKGRKAPISNDFASKSSRAYSSSYETDDEKVDGRYYRGTRRNPDGRRPAQPTGREAGKVI